MDKFKVGDMVKTNSNAYEGRVVGVMHTTTYSVSDGTDYNTFNEDQLELCALSQVDVWDQVAVIVLNVSNAALYPSRKHIRHMVYKMLGATGIKIVPDVKKRVRSIIYDIETAASLDLYE